MAATDSPLWAEYFAVMAAEHPGLRPCVVCNLPLEHFADEDGPFCRDYCREIRDQHLGRGTERLAALVRLEIRRARRSRRALGTPRETLF